MTRSRSVERLLTVQVELTELEPRRFFARSRFARGASVSTGPRLVLAVDDEQACRVTLLLRKSSCVGAPVRPSFIENAMKEGLPARALGAPSTRKGQRGSKRSARTTRTLVERRLRAARNAVQGGTRGDVPGSRSVAWRRSVAAYIASRCVGRSQVAAETAADLSSMLAVPSRRRAHTS